MLKKRKYKKRVSIFIASLFTLAGLTVYVLSPYINGYLILNMLPVLSSNGNSTGAFYGENIDMSQILPTSQHYVVNSKGQDLIDIAADLGINLIRITNIQRSFNNNADSIYTEDQWNQVLTKMQGKGIKALILIEAASNNKDYYTRDIRPVYLNLVQKYVDSGVFSNPDVYAVDIKNEPLLTDANINMLQSAHTLIKAKYPSLKQTIGAWSTYHGSLKNPYHAPSSALDWLDFSAGQKIANIVDFYSLHMYGLGTTNTIGLNPGLRTKVFVSEAENGLQTQKPILIEEFGEANGNAVTDQDTIGSPELQAIVYQGVYQALKEMHSSQLIGTAGFDFYSRNQYSDAWAIVKNKGNYLFPAAYILQAYALGKDTSSLYVATTVHSQSYLVKNADNHSTKTLNVSDRIGLKLQLDGGQNYLVSLSANGVLQSVDLFHYERYRGAYYAVYQAKKKGTVQFKIIPDTNCIRGSICTIPVYRLTINVQ